MVSRLAFSVPNSDLLLMRTLIVKTPLRIPLGGGGTDLPAYVKEYGGFIFGVAIDKYVHVTLTQSSFYPHIFVSTLYSGQDETKARAADLENKLVREALNLIGIEQGLAISSACDIFYGTGLGSSGAFLVGLLNALYTLNGRQTHPDFLADRASHIFLNRLQSSEGKQDPYLTALGGFSCIELDRDNSVKVIPVVIAEETQKEFRARSLYFYTGVTRSSSAILDSHQKKAAEGDEKVIGYRHRVKEIGREIKSAFEEGNLNRFGELLHSHWQAKKESSPDISVGKVDELYDKARGQGMLGGKIIGAGGGGVFMAFAKKGQEDSIREIFLRAGMPEMDLGISNKGTEIVEDKNYETIY